MNPAPISEQEERALRDLPRDGSPVGADPHGTGDGRDATLRSLQARGLVAMWPMRGWCITEAGIKALDEDSRHSVRTEMTPVCTCGRAGWKRIAACGRQHCAGRRLAKIRKVSNP